MCQKCLSARLPQQKRGYPRQLAGIPVGLPPTFAVARDLSMRLSFFFSRARDRIGSILISTALSFSLLLQDPFLNFLNTIQTRKGIIIPGTCNQRPVWLWTQHHQYNFLHTRGAASFSAPQHPNTPYLSFPTWPALICLRYTAPRGVTAATCLSLLL